MPTSYTNRYQILTPDTIVEKYYNTNVDMGMIGFGIEAQRTFYKRIVLFAAIELRGGYGQGREQDLTVKTYSNNNEYYSSMNTTRSKDISLVHIAIAPTIGAKFQFSRINFGLEMTAINMYYNKFDTKDIYSYGAADFSLGELSTRAFIGYNF